MHIAQNLQTVVTVYRQTIMSSVYGRNEMILRGRSHELLAASGFCRGESLSSYRKHMRVIVCIYPIMIQ